MNKVERLEKKLATYPPVVVKDGDFIYVTILYRLGGWSTRTHVVRISEINSVDVLDWHESNSLPYLNIQVGNVVHEWKFIRTDRSENYPPKDEMRPTLENYMKKLRNQIMEVVLNHTRIAK